MGDIPIIIFMRIYDVCSVVLDWNVIHLYDLYDVCSFYKSIMIYNVIPKNAETQKCIQNDIGPVSQKLRPSSRGKLPNYQNLTPWVGPPKPMGLF